MLKLVNYKTHAKRFRVKLSTFEDLRNHYKVNENGCWIWLRDKNSHGYGRVTFSGKRQGAHRVSWMLFHQISTLPPEVNLLHSCDTPACINPMHLSEGNGLANTKDCISKGRAAYQKKLMCKKGHPWDEANLYVTVIKSGPSKGKVQRVCKICESNRKKIVWLEKTRGWIEQ